VNFQPATLLTRSNVTQAATLLSATSAPASAGVLLPAFTLWWREVVRFYRQRARVVGVIALRFCFGSYSDRALGPPFVLGKPPGSSIISIISTPARW